MWNIILTDLVPIFVIMILGYVAGKRGAFDMANSKSFNKFVLNYALPAALFLSIVKGNREMLFQDAKLLILSFVIIVACYFWSYFSCKKFFKHTKAEASVCGLIGGAPTIGFLGFAVLEPIFGDNANTGLVVAIVAIMVNAIAIPICLFLLNPKDSTSESTPANAAPQGSANATTKDSTTATGATTATAAAKPQHKSSGGRALLNAIKEPVVWSPILAVIIILCDIKFPVKLDPTFDLIAKANAGVAVFAAGLTLSAHKFEFDKEVLSNTFVKFIVMLAALLIFGKLIGMEPEKLQMLVLAGALPPVFSGVIIGTTYSTYVRTGTSSLAVSTILFMATAPLWIWLARAFT